MDWNIGAVFLAAVYDDCNDYLKISYKKCCTGCWKIIMFVPIMMILLQTDNTL